MSFQFYKSTIITFDFFWKKLQKYCFNSTKVRLLPSTVATASRTTAVSILQKYDYYILLLFVLMIVVMFQFYKSTIITCQRMRNKLTGSVSILQKYDYYKKNRDQNGNILKFQFYKSTIITSTSLRCLISFNTFQFYKSTIITALYCIL